MNKNLLTLLLTLVIFGFMAEAQSVSKKFGFEVNGGIREYHGDLGSAAYLTYRPDYQQIGGSFGMYLNPSFDVNLYGSVGDLGYYKQTWDEVKADYYRQGFRTRITDAMLGVTYKFNNGYILNEDARVKPFLKAGWGVMQSVSNISHNKEGYTNSRTWLASHWNAGLGFKIKLTDGLDLVLNEQANYTFDDNYDGAPYVIAGAQLNNAQDGNKPLHDIYLTHSLGFAFNFGDNGNSGYKIKDSDNDGISDKFDICPNTPEGYAVDTVGCPLDTDKDGVVDEEDKCPTVPGTVASNGCPDTDGDGIVDADDKCPDVPGLKAFNGCPDSDKDGIQDSEDKCPLKAGTKEGEGCPDSDGDGVYDHKDFCPATAGPATNKGCPEIKEEVKEQIALAAKGIYFESEKDIIKNESFANLDKLSKILQEYDKAKVIIEGHTDSQGEDAANLELSQKRADAVKRYLASHGIVAERMTSIGYGEIQPLADNGSAEGRALNRRVDFKLVY